VNLRVLISKTECTNELVTTAKIYSIEGDKDVGRRCRGLLQGSLLHLGMSRTFTIYSHEHPAFVQMEYDWHYF